MDSKKFLERMAASEASRVEVMTELYADIRDLARKACRRGGLYRPEDLDEVIQDCCIAVLSKWRGFRGESPLGAWLWRILFNLVTDHHRYNGRWRSLDEPRPTDDGEFAEPPPELQQSVDERLEQRLCVEQVMKHLLDEKPPRDGSVRTVDLLEFIADVGTDTPALAEFLGCGEGAAKERKRYALQKFRSLCQHYCGTEDCVLAPAS